MKKIYYYLLAVLILLSACSNTVDTREEEFLSGAGESFDIINMTIFFPLNETSGVIAENYGSASTTLNGTIVGTTHSEFNTDGSGLYLKGTASWPNMFKLSAGESGELTTPSGGDHSTSFVIEFNDTSYSIDPRIISWRDGGDSTIYFDESANTLCVLYLDRTLCTTSTFSIGDKIHLAFTFDNSANTGRIYINSTLDNTNTNMDQNFAHNPSAFNIGHRDFDRPFNGTISMVRDWADYELSSAQVIEVFNTDLNFTVETPVISCYDSNAGKGYSYQVLSNGTAEWLGGTNCQFDPKTI